MNEDLEEIRKEWRSGGLERCLDGEKPPVYLKPHPSRVVQWHGQEVRIPWTAAEDALMRDIYRTQGYVGLLDLLPTRSRDAIQGRARTLGLQITRRGPRPRGLA